ncbi:hypothetical protein I546_0980 [Mycobacterium kansasii 732]|nr:hypothetical protein I546_0980 [Mycobacterium kansasii 732]
MRIDGDQSRVGTGPAGWGVTSTTPASPRTEAPVTALPSRIDESAMPAITFVTMRDYRR